MGQMEQTEPVTGSTADRPARPMSRRATRLSTTAGTGQVDAELFLALSLRLKTAFTELINAQLPGPRRARWQHRLIAITDAAKDDLGRAARQLDRYEDDFRRETAA